MSSIVINGDTSGAVTLSAPAIAGPGTTSVVLPSGGVTVTLPSATDTLVGKATTDTLTNKTITAPVLSGSITGTYTLAGTPTITSPTITGASITLAASAAPAFSAYLLSTQSVTSSVETKITINTEVFDTNSNFDSATNYRFTPTVAGYYQVNGVLRLSGSSLSAGWVAIFKNGSTYSRGTEYNTALTNVPQLVVTDIVYCNGSTDYIELYGLNTASSPTFQAVSAAITARFSAAMVRSA